MKTKLILAWLVLLMAATGIATSCSINHKSNQFECTVAADCEPPRICDDGVCVLPGGTVDASDGDASWPDASIDASVDAPRCPAQCSSCDSGDRTCVIDCAAPGTSCNSAVTCPQGWNCEIKCSTPDSCRAGVNCLNSASCEVQCTGPRSCRNVMCGEGRCDVTCSGSQSCRGVSCGDSCACDVDCVPGAACEGVMCSAFQCRLGFDCASQLPGCNTCQ